MIKEIDVTGVPVEILDNSKTLLEMADNDIKFLVGQIRKFKPRNILEIGVSAGGSSFYILREMGMKSKLTSVDICENWYRDGSKKTGFIVDNLKNEIGDEKYNKWKLILGKDILYRLDELGNEKFDFVLIDTMHSMPGEFLSYLAILPFVKNKAPIVLHDTLLHYHFCVQHNLKEHVNDCFCTNLLLSSAASKHKEMPKPYCNIGMLIKDKTTEENLVDAIRTMIIPWHYMPEDQYLNDYAQYVEKTYGETCARYFRYAIEYNKLSREMQKEIDKIA